MEWNGDFGSEYSEDTTSVAEDRAGMIGTADGFAGHLAGHSAGWTVKQRAKCCANYLYFL